MMPPVFEGELLRARHARFNLPVTPPHQQLHPILFTQRHNLILIFLSFFHFGIR